MSLKIWCLKIELSQEYFLTHYIVKQEDLRQEPNRTSWNMRSDQKVPGLILLEENKVHNWNINKVTYLATLAAFIPLSGSCPFA
jgi:hypothetical protein